MAAMTRQMRCDSAGTGARGEAAAKWCGAIGNAWIGPRWVTSRCTTLKEFKGSLNGKLHSPISSNDLGSIYIPSANIPES